MNFSDFAKLMYPHIGKGQEIPDYVLSLIDMVMEEPYNDADTEASEDDAYNPLSNLSGNSLNKIYNGERNISKKNASVICNHFSKTKLIDAIHSLNPDAQNQLCVALAERDISTTEDIVDECCAEILSQILHNLASGSKNTIQQSQANSTYSTETHDELKNRLFSSALTVADILGGVTESFLYIPQKNGDVTLTPINPTRYDNSSKTIYLGSEEIVLPIQLVPESELESHELPYINALCEVYAEKICQEVTPDLIDTLPSTYKRHFAEQRKAYYSAESVHRSVREVFSDGEQQFSALKDDAFDGIEPTYYDDSYASGYDRLRAVLEKITSTTLSKSTLVNIIGMISNLEKKGICHMLVNDERIRSWVVIDDEIV